MVETIDPVVHGGRRRSYRLAIALHTLAAGASALALGALSGGAGALVGAPWGRLGWGLLAMGALIYLAGEGLSLSIPVPAARRQVPEWWRSFFSPLTAAALYGMGLGAGFFTYLSHGTLVVVATASFISGSPLVGAVLCAPFGVARGLSLALAHWRSDAAPRWDETLLVDRIEALGATAGPRLAHGAALAAVSGTALAAFAG
jgi:hypothetical protein